MFIKLGTYLIVVFVLLSLWFRYGYAEIPCLAGKDGIVALEMEARPVAIELRPGIFFDAWGYCLKGEKPTVPGPTIKVREGTKIRIHLANKLSVPAAVHPHGVKYTTANDGAHIAGNPTSMWNQVIPGPLNGIPPVHPVHGFTTPMPLKGMAKRDYTGGYGGHLLWNQRGVTLTFLTKNLWSSCTHSM